MCSWCGPTAAATTPPAAPSSENRLCMGKIAPDLDQSREVGEWASHPACLRFMRACLHTTLGSSAALPLLIAPSPLFAFCSEMCDAIEDAFCQLWEQAGLGSAASAKAPRPAAPARATGSHQAGAARSHHAAQPSKAHRSKQAGGSHKSAAHGRQQSHGKQSHAKQPRGTPTGHNPEASSAAGKASGRKRPAASETAAGGSKRQHVSPHAGQQQQQAAEQQQQQQQSAEEPLLAPPVQQAEEAEEGLELQRLLGTSIGPAAADAAAAAAGVAAAGGAAGALPASPMAGSRSPALWEAGPGPGLGAARLAPQGAAAAGSHGAAGQPADPFLQRWQAAGSSPFAPAAGAQDPRVARALLHPDRDGGGGASLPLLLPAQQPLAAAAAGPAVAAAQALPDGLQALGNLSSRLPSLQLPVLSGLAAATAAVTPDQLQQEQRVLGAWQQVQQQRELALRAMLAAERANAELAQARAEAAEAQAAAEAAAAAAQPCSPEPRQHGHREGGDASGRPANVRLVPAGCGADLKTLAASVRQVESCCRAQDVEGVPCHVVVLKRAATESGGWRRSGFPVLPSCSRSVPLVPCLQSCSNLATWACICGCLAHAL